MNEHVTINADGSANIALSKDIEIAGVKVSALRMREPTVNDQLVMDATPGSDAVKEIAFFANLTGQTPNEIKSLSLRDYKRVQAAFGLFTD